MDLNVKFISVELEHMIPGFKLFHSWVNFAIHVFPSSPILALIEALLMLVAIFNED